MSVESILRIFCENVRYLRRVHDLSIEEMAQKLNISVSDLCSLEDGIIPEDMDITVLETIGQAFSVPTSRLFNPFA